MRKSILITGCSSGIGRDAALGLQRRGWRVFASCRKEADCQELRDQGADPAQTQDSLFVLLPEARHFQPLDSSLWQAICTGSQRI